MIDLDDHAGEYYADQLPEAIKRVRAGVEWLDKNYPGWLDKVEVNELELEDSCKCVLGQLFSEEAVNSDEFTGFGYAMNVVFDPDAEFPYDKVSRLGFDSDGDVCFSALQIVWEDAISSRKEKA